MVLVNLISKGQLCFTSSGLALFPGPAQLSVACSTVLQVTESWAGPGNEPTSGSYPYTSVRAYLIQPGNCVWCPIDNNQLYIRNVHTLGQQHNGNI